MGHLDDIQRGLERLGPLLAPGGRLIVTYYNFLWEPVLKLAERLGLKTPWPEQNWLSMNDIENLLGLAGFEVVRRGTDILLPVDVPGVSDLANRVVANLPVLRGGRRSWTTSSRAPWSERAGGAAARPCRSSAPAGTRRATSARRSPGRR